MNSHGSAAPAMAELSDVGQRARRRIAYRLLPFVFLIYIVNYVASTTTYEKEHPHVDLIA